MPPVMMDMSAASQSPYPKPQRRRPASLAELADRARNHGWDPNMGIKHWLRTAEKHRNKGTALVSSGDLEAGFVELATAATLVLEKVPTHRDYISMLNPSLRKNLGENGQSILDSLGKLKPVLLDRHERWVAQHPEAADSSSGTTAEQAHATKEEEARLREEENARRREEANARRREEEIARRREEDRRQEERQEQNGRFFEQRQVDVRRDHDAEVRRRQEEQRSHDPEARRKADVMASVSRAAGVGQQGSVGYAGGNDVNAVLHPDYRRQEEMRRQQEDGRRREEEIMKRRTEDRRRQEQDGIARRQQEAEAAAQAARRRHIPQLPVPVASSLSESSANFPPNLMMPLESPTRYDDDSTDAETAAKGSSFRARRMDQHKAQRQEPTFGRTAHRNASYPPPVTTTSPAPHDGLIRYPSLMTKHQMTQGYAPSLASMFNPSMKAQNTPASLLFVPESNKPSSLYPASLLPQSSTAVSQPPSSTLYGMPTPQHYPAPQARSQSQPHPSNSYPGPARAPPTMPQATADTQRMDSRITRSVSKTDPVVHDLKNVNVPRDCLPRFLAIAAINTAKNRETCGLLLGKDKGHKFVVTTLLIPKQHSTSDTCTMDEEELVMQFTEERNLITLGWIHTHPSQSCFMSSVDLHTHSGFQRMLPESFAVVCAPKSTPNFGIFRLTDPPGLTTILDCKAKEAFHPHPDVPIYTDADKGHVQMKDMSLEIVDLREG